MKSNYKGQNVEGKWTLNESFHFKKKKLKKGQTEKSLSFKFFIEVNIPWGHSYQNCKKFQEYKLPFE